MLYNLDLIKKKFLLKRATLKRILMVFLVDIAIYGGYSIQSHI